MSVQVNSAIEYIPLSGTRVGEPVSGDILKYQGNERIAI
jgi:hypothetical protein